MQICLLKANAVLSLVPTRTHPGLSLASEISNSLLFRSQGLLQEFLDLIDVSLHIPVESQEGRMGARGEVVQVGWLSAERSRFRRWLTQGHFAFTATYNLCIRLPGLSPISIGRTDLWWGCRAGDGGESSEGMK